MWSGPFSFGLSPKAIFGASQRSLRGDAVRAVAVPFFSNFVNPAKLFQNQARFRLVTRLRIADVHPEAIQHHPADPAGFG